MGSLRDRNAWISVYKFLKDGITKGTYAPGEKLNERAIAELVNVSRTPTREALGVCYKYCKKGCFWRQGDVGSETT